MRKANKNIIKIFESATEEEYTAGLNWFNGARDIANKMAIDFNIPIKKVAAIISILSPAVKWESNILDARNLLQGWSENKQDAVKTTGYGHNKAKAIRVLEYKDDNFKFPISAGSFKTLCFYENIVDPSSLRATIDRHAAKVYYGAKRSGRINLSGKKYLMIEKSFINTSEYLNLLPCQLQAITWVAYKRLVNR